MDTTVHFHCASLPQLNLGGGGMSPSRYVRFLMDLTGEGVDVCIDLYDKIVRQAMIGGHFNHLSHEMYGPFNRVVEVIRHAGGRRRDVAGMGDVEEDVTATILFYAPFDGAWHLAKVTARAHRPCNFFGGSELRWWKAAALAAVYPVFADRIAETVK